MLSEKLYKEFQELVRKIHLLLNENKRLREELRQSQSENQTLQSKIKNQKVNLDAVQNDRKMNKIIDNMIVGEEESAMLKAQIDSYVKEIDKCIAYLAK